jgi:hypothetical protein
MKALAFTFTLALATDTSSVPAKAIMAIFFFITDSVFMMLKIKDTTYLNSIFSMPLQILL